MEKHYAVGMYGGKFLPYHRGHFYCLEVASRMCDQVWQVLTAGGVEEEAFLRGATPEERIRYSPQERLRRMREAGNRLGNVKTVLLDISGCRMPDGQEDWDAETPLVLSACGCFDAVFGSEPSYGEYFRRAYPWATYVLVDPPRRVVPISGTRVRAMDDEHAKVWMTR